MGVSPPSLARALARRLNEVLPASFRVTVEEYVVELLFDGRWDSTIVTLDIVDDETRELRERLETSVWGVLNSIQEGVVEHLGKAWPSPEGPEVVIPVVSFDGTAIHLCYGDREGVPVVQMPNIPLAEIAEEPTADAP